MPRRWAIRWAILGAAAFGVGIGALLWSVRPKGFDAAGLNIDPRARIDPQRPYEIIVWEEIIPAPWAVQSQAEAVEAAIRAFREQHPNVRVTYALIDPDTARERLSDAVASGQPPDVYGSAKGLIVHPSLQIPAGPYIPPVRGEEPPLFHPAAVDALTKSGIVWGWPRGLWWNGWLVAIDAWDRVAGEAGSGWTWDRMREWAGEELARGRHPVMLNAADVTTLESLVMNAGSPGYRSGADAPGWTEASVAKAAGFLEQLRSLPAMPSDPDRMSRTRIESLIGGRAAAIGPVRPHLAQAVFRRQPGRFVLAPWPHDAGSDPVTPVEVGGYFVFRQSTYKGDDHTRTAMELADFLAARSDRWLASQLGVLPARPAHLPEWQDQAPLDARSREALAALWPRARPVSAGLEQRELDALRERLRSTWQAFWDERMPAEEFAQKVITALDPAVWPGAGP
ncbi:MAG: extracellular solute-binding protein [Firmicutes bacterium]|nr:extracellular solute-binding protein [Bacillota bacterium]